MHMGGTEFRASASAAMAEGPPQQKLLSAHPGRGVVGANCQVEMGPGDDKTLSPQRALSLGRHSLGAPCLLASLEFCPRQALVESWSPSSPPSS